MEKAKARVERSMIQRKARIHTGGIEGVRLGKGKFLRKKRGRKSNGGANICQGEDSPGAESRIYGQEGFDEREKAGRLSVSG